MVDIARKLVEEYGLRQGGRRDFVDRYRFELEDLLIKAMTQHEATKEAKPKRYL